MLIKRMADSLRISEKFVLSVANNADHLYKEYRIDKKTGGTRTIHHPAKRLKVLQRWLTIHFIASLPVHRSATAYRIGMSIRDNAEIHRKHNYMLRIDMEEFFPSLRDVDVRRVLSAHAGKFNPKLSRQDIVLISKIVCRSRRLTIGAPSSPALSNAILYEFDVYWHRLCARRGVSYSRYADDIVLSTDSQNILGEIYERMIKTINRTGNLNLKINTKKTVFTSKKHFKKVTGLVITPTEQISIGRSRKREIRTLLYLHLNGRLDQLRQDYLHGLIAFAHAVEPSFVESLRRKFGLQSIFPRA